MCISENVSADSKVSSWMCSATITWPYTCGAVHVY